MGEIIHVKNTAYARYEELLMKRDNLKKEAFQLDREYVRIFGEKIIKVFEQKLACIEKKMTITFCQAAVNRGNAVDPDELNKYIDKKMASYREELGRMVEDNNAAKSSSEVSESEIFEIKKIYRRLAKQIHPDINPMTPKNAQLSELWERVTIAYRCNRLKEIQELEILVTAALKAVGEGKNEIDILDIEEKISEVEEEIENIKTTDPYMYKFILIDEEAVKEKNAALDEEFASYKNYAKQLDEILQGLTGNGVTITWRMN